MAEFADDADAVSATDTLDDGAPPFKRRGSRFSTLDALERVAFATWAQRPAERCGGARRALAWNGCARRSAGLRRALTSAHRSARLIMNNHDGRDAFCKYLRAARVPVDVAEISPLAGLSERFASEPGGSLHHDWTPSQHDLPDCPPTTQFVDGVRVVLGAPPSAAAAPVAAPSDMDDLVALHMPGFVTSPYATSLVKRYASARPPCEMPTLHTAVIAQAAPRGQQRQRGITFHRAGPQACVARVRGARRPRHPMLTERVRAQQDPGKGPRAAGRGRARVAAALPVRGGAAAARVLRGGRVPAGAGACADSAVQQSGATPFAAVRIVMCVRGSRWST
jgi:hypothetical protein